VSVCLTPTLGSDAGTVTTVRAIQLFLVSAEVVSLVPRARPGASILLAD